MISKAYARFIAVQKQFPARTSMITGATVMAVGDTFTQMSFEEHFDARRTCVVSTFNGFAAPFFYSWWMLLDRFLPGTAPVIVAKKVLINQCLMAPPNNAFFLIWTTTVSQVLASRCGTKPFDSEQLYSDIWAKLQRELPNMLLSSCGFWMPANVFNFMFVPLHLRIAFMSSCGVVWGAYISFLAHR